MFGSKLHRSQITLFWSLSFMLGVAHLLWALGVLALFMRLLFPRAKLRWAFFGVIAVFLLGWWRYDNFLPTTNRIPYGQEVFFQGTVVRPPQKGKIQQITVRNNAWAGYVLMTVPLYPAYHYGDLLKVRCNLQRPTPTSDFAYDKYLARFGILSQCGYAHVELMETNQGSTVLDYIYQFRGWLQQRFKTIYPEPAASIVIGLILGIKDDIPQEITDLFRRTGTMHLLVVSGMQVVLIAAACTSITKRWFSPRKQFALLVVVLVTFSILTGLSASVIRASAMGLIIPFARLLGRPHHAHILLAVLAATLSAINPYMLIHDLGFQLSFLATLGIIYLQMPIGRVFRFLPNILWFRETITVSIAALIPVTPLLIAQFGTFSTISILANALAVPASTIVLFGGVATIALSLMSLQFSWVIAYPLWWLIKLTLAYLKMILGFPYAYLEEITIPLWLVAFSYIFFAIFILWRAQRTSSVSA